MTDQAENLRSLMNHSGSVDNPSLAQPRVVAVASGKGGVGKSNFCVNFALGLQQEHQHPVVLDVDVGFADVELLLGTRPLRTIVDVLQGMSIWEALEYHSSGLPFLSAGNGLLQLDEMTSSHMDLLFDQMKQLQDKHNVVILDCGAGLGGNQGRLLSAADDLIIITTPEPTSLADAYALLKMLVTRAALPPTKIVVNRVRNFVEGRETAEKLQMVADRFLDAKLSVLGYILEDSAVSAAVRQQEAFLALHPHSPAARCMTQLVQNYLRTEPRVPRRGIVGFLEKMFGKGRSGGEFDTSHPA
jgi:flagellar biosynthesis protein FlhG